MKQIRKIRKYILTGLCLSFVLTSCGNSLLEKINNTVVEPVETTAEDGIVIKGTIAQKGASPSRSATSLDSLDGKVTWMITATNFLPDGTTSEYSSETTSGVFTTNQSFILKIPQPGKWYINVSGFPGVWTEAEITAASQNQEMQPFYIGSQTIDVDEKGAATPLIIYVSMSQRALNHNSDIPAGSFKLKFEDETEMLFKVTANLKPYQSENQSIKAEGNFEQGVAFIEATKVTAGFYTATINFEDGAGNIVYSCNEAINIYPGLTTDTWYGTAPYLIGEYNLSGSKFILSSEIINKYPSEKVPSTQLMLYDYGIKEETNTEHGYSYYLVDIDNINNVTTPTVTSQYTAEFHPLNDSTFFDSQGNFYLAQILDDYDTYLKSTKEEWESPSIKDQLGFTYDDKKSYVFKVDFYNDNLCVLENFTDAETEISVHVFPNLISLNGTDYTKKTSSLQLGDNPTSYYNTIFAVNNNLLYLLLETDSSNHTYAIRIYDLSEYQEVFSYKETKTLSLSTILNMSTLNGGISDMIYQDGSLYLLYKEDDYSFSSGMYSRGCVIKYNLLTGDYLVTGLTENGISQGNGYKLPAFYRNSNAYHFPLIVTDTQKPFLPDVSVDNYPVIYQPSATKKCFYGPSKFIAVKPNLLIIADEGREYYVEDGVLYWQNINQVAVVNLIDFTVEKIEPVRELSLSMDTINDIYSYTKISDDPGVALSYEEYGSVNEYSGGYYLGIAYKSK